VVDPRQDSVLHFNLGRVLASKERYEAAALELEHSVRLYPRAAKPYVLLSSVHRSTGRCDRALEWAARGLELNPVEPALHFEIGRAYLCDGQPELAVAQLEKVLEEHPDHRQARQLLEDITRGRSPEP